MSAQVALTAPIAARRGAAALDSAEQRSALRVRLRQSSIFRVLGEPDLEEAVALARRQVRRRGELVQDGDGAGSNFYVVLTGAVRCSLLSSDGNKVTLGTIRPGMAFWLEPTDAQLIATFCGEILVDDTQLCRLPYHFVRQLMARDPRFAIEMYDVIYAWCATFRDRLAELAHDQVSTRLAHLLGRLAAADDRHTVMETHDELAWWIGTSRVRVTKELHGLRERGLIDYRPHVRGIQVPDPQRLGAFRD
jgi:CRP-like cAMP-binding protein